MTDNKVKDNEIVKSLKCVPKDVSGYIIDENNKMKLVYNEDVIDLINCLQAKVLKEQNKNSKLRNERNRLQSQNKDLAETTHNLIIEKDALFDKTEELKAENERLKEGNKILDLNRRMALLEKEPLYDKIKTAKSEAVKEFVERLKENISDDCRIVSDEGEYVGYDCDDVMYCINNLVKEFERKENTIYDG